MRGRKKMERKEILHRAHYARFRIEDAKRLDKACSKANMTYSEYIRDAVIEKLEREKDV